MLHSTAALWETGRPAGTCTPQDIQDMTTESPTIVCPGMRLGSTAHFTAGEGTYVLPASSSSSLSSASSSSSDEEGIIVASVTGFRHVEQLAPASDTTAMDASSDEQPRKPRSNKPVLQVLRHHSDATSVPMIGSIVTGKVTNVNPRFAKIAIVCVGSVPLKETFRGMIRVQDVRETEKDKVEIYKSFRPGDIVRAEVISLGDARSYYLSTAKNELGVVFAESAAGASMIPISWCEMQCPKTKAKEFRKVAKTF